MADEPEVYATVDDLKKRWPDFPLGAEDHAEVLLEDASAMVRARAPDVANVDPGILRIVVCDMVKTVLQSPGDGANVSALNLTAGPFSQQVSYRDSSDLFITSKHAGMLGCGRQRAFTVRMGGTNADP
ncbi:hypothetical protein [Leucobacter aridicollis]|uniref:Head-to-tail adaptor n=1 Tax=Leucobacter aridicollis TaxID=283878 RepID=A0A852R564_9MICO|nr:hypothetical protein [Leucobacter aridicollis]MBL3682656.1 hypothetical protein [Leucobacter aridicollis]NYD26088.1 hypothetical protein [Leucobacter aridicollis]